jgi:hypothetical protein
MKEQQLAKGLFLFLNSIQNRFMVSSLV